MSVAYYKNQLLTNLADSTKINYKAYYQNNILFGANSTTGDTPTPTHQYYIHYKSSTHDVIDFDTENQATEYFPDYTHPFTEYELVSNTYDSLNDIGTLEFTSPITALTSPNDYDLHDYYGSIFTVNGVASQDLVEVEIPATVTVINGRIFGSYDAFIVGKNENVSAVTFENNSRLIEVRGDCFQGCGEMTSIELPEGLTTIGRGVFTNDLNWESIILPSTLVVLDDVYCFFGLRSLSSYPRITFKSATPPTLASGAINNCYGTFAKRGTLYVPSESISAYQTAFTRTSNKNFYLWNVSAISE